MSDLSPVSILDDGDRAIYVVTTCYQDSTSGMIVTWVTSASLIPERKRVVLVVSPHHVTTQMLLQSRTFVLHQLAHEQAHLVPTFGLFSSREVDKFAQLAVQLDDRGIPMLSGTCGWVRGNVVAHMDGGDRFIVLAEVDAEEVTATTQSLFVRDLAHTLPVDMLKQLEEKYRRDVERDRTLIQTLDQGK